MNPLPVTLADMRKNVRGVIAVVALIAIAVSLGVGISAQERAVRLGSNVASDPIDLLIGAPGSQTQLLLSSVYLRPGSLNLVPGELLRELEGTDGVEYAAPIGFGDSYLGRPIIGTIAEFVTLGGSEPLVEGRMFRSIHEAVVGVNVDLAMGDTIVPVHGQIEGAEGEVHDYVSFEVVGRFASRRSPWDEAILVPIESVWNVHGLGTGHEDIRPLGEGKEILGEDHDDSEHDEGHADSAPDELEHEAQDVRANDEPEHDDGEEHPHGGEPSHLGPPFEARIIPGVPAIVVKPETIRDAYVLRSRYRSDPRTNAIFPAEVLVELYALLGDTTTVMSALAVATQVLVVGAVLLAAYAALQQKRQALGVLRALGAPRKYLFLSVWLEIVCMVAAGSAIGLVLGWAVAWLISQIISAETGLILRVTLASKEVVLVLVLIGAGMVLAAIPSIKVYRQPVSKLLRS